MRIIHNKKTFVHDLRCLQYTLHYNYSHIYLHLSLPHNTTDLMNMVFVDYKLHKKISHYFRDRHWCLNSITYFDIAVALALAFYDTLFRR